MKFDQYLGKYVCGNLSEMDYPELGIAGLIENFESKYLAILAGMNRTDKIRDFRKYLKWTITELNIILPTKREAALLYASGIVTSILNKNIDVVKGVSEIKNCALVNYDFFSENKKILL